MANTGRVVVGLGVIAVGGYLAYEYMQYSNGMQQYAKNTGTDVNTAEANLPFFTYVYMKLAATFQAGDSTTLPGTQQQIAIFNAIVYPGAPATPGTTTSTQGTPTSISTAPSSTRPPLTTMFHISSGAPTLERKAPVILPPSIAMRAVLGPTSRGLPPPKLPQQAASPTGGRAPFFAGHGTRGFGAIEVVPGTVVDPIGNLLYQAHHPWPYLPSYTLKGIPGLGTITQATGFEKALLAGAPIRSRFIQ